jgi:hypothetical protein
MKSDGKTKSEPKAKKPRYSRRRKKTEKVMEEAKLPSPDPPKRSVPELKLKEAVILEEVLDAPIPENHEAYPEIKPVALDTEQYVEAEALMDGVANIGVNRYILEKGKPVLGGILRAHISMLEKAGKVKQMKIT